MKPGRKLFRALKANITCRLTGCRLLSAAGIPKLRKISKDKFKFKGKGNEVSLTADTNQRLRLTFVQFTDMAKLLNTYQLWLDDLFPKAKFLDGLTMVEKLGHKKKIQIYRKEWIDEGKPRSADDDLDDFIATRGNQTIDRGAGEGRDTLDNIPEEAQVVRDVLPGRDHEQLSPQGGNEPDEDELDALLQEASAETFQTQSPTIKTRQSIQEPDEDELDALLAEDGPAAAAPKSLFGGPSSREKSPPKQPVDDFADEEEAMAGLDW